ncbi:unnamed protein product [Darwinula stevensoni]|uniref:Ultrabithorax n=1 Tax=Darwinula stevensoni TaxID=69355 RepID=A0A7R8WY26_9CRUS|nr:unnamed protein product [Darwinula stevensoni]CAG0878595.1 unnamed protein product [Darwinula stevensoni]
MNSYFEQSGFYGGQSGDQAAAAAAAYRFPLGLSVSPYGQTQARTSQDLAYDTSAASACKLYGATSPSADSSAYKVECVTKEQTSFPTSTSKDMGLGSWAGGALGAMRAPVGTPDPSRYGDPTGARASWNHCSLNNTAPAGMVGQPMQQAANHTFYPWMAIAGR